MCKKYVGEREKREICRSDIRLASAPQSHKKDTGVLRELFDENTNNLN